MNDTLLLAAARNAYERGRLRTAIRSALWVLPASLLPLQHCMAAGRGALMLFVVVALCALVTLFKWRGQEFARGTDVGLIAGCTPLVLPMLAGWIAPMCSATVCEWLPAASVAGGFLGALCLAGGGLARTADEPSDRRPGAGFWFSAISVTATLGIAGCLHVGLAGLTGLALGLTAGTVPAIAYYAVRTR